MDFAVFVAVALCGLLLAFWLGSEPLRRAWRRHGIRRAPFPAAWRDILRRRVPYFQRLPADLQLQLKRHIQVFLAEKPIIGCDGLVVTEEMRVTIAAQACLLLLGRRSDYFPNLRQILVYPGAFVVRRHVTDDIGLQQDRREVLAGESWSQGQVILSWDDTLAGAADPADGRNVVIHEFAHQLDQEKGEATGAPLLPRRADYTRWARVMGTAFALLQAQAAVGAPSLLDHYGATNPAEFFAVASETFFERAPELAREQPELFDTLRQYYCVNPLSW
ncbi:M90 family metallopeptidase [Viridibacterium curvum]|uniref:Zinc-dependent peptidase n=1 Tax=Viridibacterium curvum TaxID=1101404 RepID=A0ABP9QPT3_9RHOO